MTPQDAQRRIRAIQADKDHAYHDPRNPQHQDATEVMRRLYDVVYPGGEPLLDDAQSLVERAQAAIREKEGDADFMAAYLEPGHASHAEAATTMRALYGAGYPEQPVETMFDDAGGGDRSE